MVWYSHLFQNFPQFIAIHTFEVNFLVNYKEMIDHFFFSLLIHVLVGKHWRREWQPIPVFLPGEFHGYRIAWKIPWIEKPGVYSPWTCKEYDRTDDLISLSVIPFTKAYLTFRLWDML